MIKNIKKEKIVTAVKNGDKLYKDLLYKFLRYFNEDEIKKLINKKKRQLKIKKAIRNAEINKMNRTNNFLEKLSAEEINEIILKIG